MRLDRKERILLSHRFCYPRRPIIKLSESQEKARKGIIDCIKKGEFKFTQVNCRCGSDDDLLIATVDRYGFWVRTVICKNCGLLRTNPRLNQASLDKLYNDMYRNLYSGDKTIEEEFRSQVWRGRRILELIEPYLASEKEGSNLSRVVFEIGSGAGGILLPFKQKGWLTYGCDFDERYLEFGRRQSLNLYHGGMEKLIQLEVKPDLIILSHVIEHIPELDGFIQSLASLIDKNTLLYIEVPGIFNIRKEYANDFLMYLQNAHLYHFTLATLRTLMLENGFSFVAGDEFVRALFMKDSLSGATHQTASAVSSYEETDRSASHDIIEYLTNLESMQERLISKLLSLRRSAGGKIRRMLR